METRLPGGDAPREAPSPFRPLAESGREIRGSSPPIQGDLSSGVAREPTRTEKSSAPGPAEPRSAAGGYPKTHVVVKGDSFWGLADRYYGDGTLSPVLVKANPGMKLRPGMKVTIPEPPPQSRPPAPVATGSREERAPEKPAAPAGSRDYVVQKGDTLGLIARKFYGDPAKLHLIEEANPDLKYQMLQAGARIKVPARAE